MNADDSWLHRVGKVVIFGSYLSNQERIGDIDLAIRLDRRPQFADRWAEAVLARAEQSAEGTAFGGSSTDLLGLKMRCDISAAWLKHAPHQVLFDEGPAAPVNDSNARSRHPCGSECSALGIFTFVSR